MADAATARRGACCLLFFAPSSKESHPPMLITSRQEQTSSRSLVSNVTVVATGVTSHVQSSYRKGLQLLVIRELLLSFKT